MSSIKYIGITTLCIDVLISSFAAIYYYFLGDWTIVPGAALRSVILLLLGGSYIKRKTGSAAWIIATVQVATLTSILLFVALSTQLVFIAAIAFISVSAISWILILWSGTCGELN